MRLSAQPAAVATTRCAISAWPGLQVRDECLSVNSDRMLRQTSLPPVLLKRTCLTGLHPSSFLGPSRALLRRPHFPTSSRLQTISQPEQLQSTAASQEPKTYHGCHNACQHGMVDQLAALQTWAKRCLASAAIGLSCIVSLLLSHILCLLVA